MFILFLFCPCFFFFVFLCTHSFSANNVSSPFKGKVPSVERANETVPINSHVFPSTFPILSSSPSFCCVVVCIFSRRRICMCVRTYVCECDGCFVKQNQFANKSRHSLNHSSIKSSTAHLACTLRSEWSESSAATAFLSPS